MTECGTCGIKFNNKLAHEKHNWEKHPNDMYQKYWAELKRSGKLETKSMAYQDDPYY